MKIKQELPFQEPLKGKYWVDQYNTLIKDVNKLFNYNKYIVHYRPYESKTCFGFKSKTVERYTGRGKAKGY